MFENRFGMVPPVSAPHEPAQAGERRSDRRWPEKIDVVSDGTSRIPVQNVTIDGDGLQRRRPHIPPA